MPVYIKIMPVYIKIMPVYIKIMLVYIKIMPVYNYHILIRIFVAYFYLFHSHAAR